MNACKTCGHPRDDHKGTAMICMKQVGKYSHELCDCNWFDDGTTHVLPRTSEAFVLKGKEDVHYENK